MRPPPGTRRECRPPGPAACARFGSGAPVGIPIATGSDLASDGGRRPARSSGDEAERLSRKQAARDLLSLRKRKPQNGLRLRSLDFIPPVFSSSRCTDFAEHPTAAAAVSNVSPARTRRWSSNRSANDRRCEGPDPWPIRQPPHDDSHYDRSPWVLRRSLETAGGTPHWAFWRATPGVESDGSVAPKQRCTRHFPDSSAIA
jgi:hypothetical protein